MEKRPKHEKANEILKSLEGFSINDCSSILNIVENTIEKEKNSATFTYISSIL